MSIQYYSSLGMVLLAGLTATANDTPPAVQKILPPQRLHLGDTGINPLQPIDSAAWIWHPDFGIIPATARAEVFSAGWRGPVLLRFRKNFEATATPLRIHVSADEWFELFLDGARIARGPDRAEVEHWSYASYELRLTPGQHRLEALAWNIGPNAPVAQISWRGGVILTAEAEYVRQLTTGQAPWEVAKLEGDEFTPGVFFVGAQLTARGCGPQWKEGHYVKAQVVRAAIGGNPYGESAPGWKLFPSRLPDQLDRDVNAGRAVAHLSAELVKVKNVPGLEYGTGQHRRYFLGSGYCRRVMPHNKRGHTVRPQRRRRHRLRHRLPLEAAPGEFHFGKIILAG